MSSPGRLADRTVLVAALLLAFGAEPWARGTPLITEFMASNNSTLADQDGDYADWLELYNPDSAPVNLGGWYLTNKAASPTAWQIPPVTLAPGAYLVLFCSGKNYTDPTQLMATNFNLPAAGGYVALVEPDGRTVASAYSYPAQYSDVSYGVTQPTNPAEAPQVGYFAAATPGATNGNYTNILLPEQVSFSVPPGVFAGSATVALGGAVGTQHIRYVLAPPSASGDAVPAPTAASPLYTGPLSIGATELLRAAVFSADDSQHGLPATGMYDQLDTSTANRLDTFTSNLPLVLYDDNGFGLLPDNHLFYPAWIGAFSPATGGTASLAQGAGTFSPGTRSKLHGFSSATWPKRSYEKLPWRTASATTLRSRFSA